MNTRLRFLLAAMLLVLSVFVGRLGYLQVAKADEYRARSTDNFLRQQRVTPLRGRILARDGTVLADNRIATDLMYWGGEVRGWPRIDYLLGGGLTLRPPDRDDPRERVQGVVVAWNISDTLLPALEELVAGQTNLYLRERIERTYPTNLAAHVVGYTTEADPQRFPGYALGDIVGQMGVEASFQQDLFGEPGMALAEVNSRRVVLDTREVQAAAPGQDVILTIDPVLQSAAEQALKNGLAYVNTEQRKQGLLGQETVLHGALVAMDPRTGEILALASAPDFDENIFTRRPGNPALITELLTDGVNMPLMNRAVSPFPPASTFKLVSSSALLESGFITPNTRYTCSAAYTFSGITFRNWFRSGSRGAQNVVEAIADSCNTFYFQAAGNSPGVFSGWGPYAQALTDRALAFGYGNLVGIGLDEERPGRIPTDAWSREAKGYGWRPGDSLNASIGQGDVLATPVQVAQLMATLALDGFQAHPHLVKAVGDSVTEPGGKHVPGEHWQTLKDGMRLMATGYGGRSFIGPQTDFKVALAGKTGTAQNNRGAGYEHAWFMGYGPLEAPELVVVAFVQNGGSSVYTALPIARDFMAAYWGVTP